MSPDDAPAESGRTQRVVTLMLVGALAIALTAAVVLWRDRAGLMDRVKRAEDAASGSAGPAAEAAARDAVTRMTTYDHRTVEEDFGWVEDAGTPDFEETFTGASADAIHLIKGLRSSAVGTVIDSAATVEDAGHVKVLLFVDQELRAPGQAEPALEESRVIMQMVRQDGRWLVDDVQLLNLLGQ
jgi:Mce-associated membrane protein